MAPGLRMSRVRNALFIMADQLRWDYLSCYGHRHLRTPHIDALAARGVRFEHAYVQSPVCGPSRMSSYTGRYMSSHRSTWNFVPLPIDERTLGDHLHGSGVRTALAGKTHFVADTAAIKLRGIASASPQGRRLLEGGFEPFDRMEGVYAGRHSAEFLDTPYARYLAAQGFDGGNAWHDWVNSAEGPDGEILSGWQLRHAHLPARIPEEHSETAYTTTRAIEFIREQGERPWCLHLSYIKPHWPYVAPAPYHASHGPDDVPAAVRDAQERDGAHPVFAAFMQRQESLAFSREEVRRRVVPAYMGLVQQIDDHVGRLMRFLEQAGRLDDTLIVFTSDHGDYLGDHFLGEKELFHDASARVPLIIVDPDAGADATRGSACGELAEAIDVLPTILDALDVECPAHIVEGRSLLRWTRGGTPAAAWRDVVVSELDFGFRTDTVDLLGLPHRDCRAVMLFDGRWKYVHFEGYRPQLFDLQEDPHELADLGADPAREARRREFRDRLFEWMRSRHPRVTMHDAALDGYWQRSVANGIDIGSW